MAPPWLHYLHPLLYRKRQALRGTRGRTRERLNEVAIRYLKDHGAIDPQTGKIDYNTVDAIDDEQEYKHVKDLSEYITSEADSLEIRIDCEGTHASWSITEHDLNDL